MASFTREHMPITDAGTRALLARGMRDGGHEYELAMISCILKRKLPVLDRIEQATGTPVTGASVDRTRGKHSSQSGAVLQWQRGHRLEGTRWPDATIEFKGPGGVISSVYALEFSLQNDFMRVGNSRLCRMSMAKASQLALTATILSNKPAYSQAAVHYWYLCPSEPDEETERSILNPLQNMRGTERLALRWIQVDHQG